MAQHFLLSAAARTLSLKSIYQGGEEKAYGTFCKVRWADNDGKPVCPRCGCVEAYSITTRRKFKCAGCHHQYSVTSGTIFASRKMSFTDLLAAICIFVNSAKGISALQLSRDLDCQHKTAFVLSHKLREAMSAEVHAQTVGESVEIDGAYFGGHIRPANVKEDRVDRRLAKHQTGKRRVVIALRQRGGRTLTLVGRSEAEGVEVAKRMADPNSTFYADEAAHWDALHGTFTTHRINHSEAYSDLAGTNTNQVESFFSRLRRMVAGQHHHVSPQHLHQYADHAAWLEDHRRMDNGALAHRVAGLAMAHPVSRVWKGYWQR
ncbi:IS1595 family transposase [Xanthobacter autotrophicus]|uniref:IS1595 family transposase n=1 Tax=Xanthobacter autotrophicus TaxID=280 RepID=UPI0024A6A2B9|nr:IS1595 family transposase [Xanthobacter autotrophicus]MDI4657892.1 IS1595 family transposase [Xanthobacter autotrophicus]